MHQHPWMVLQAQKPRLMLRVLEASAVSEDPARQATSERWKVLQVQKPRLMLRVLEAPAASERRPLNAEATLGGERHD